MLLIAITGFLVGLLVGLTGMGGGLLMTPLLILFYGFSPTVAIGTDLMYAGITKWFGSVQHLRQSTVDLSLVKKLAIGSIPGSLLGVFMIGVLAKLSPVSVDRILAHVLGFTFIGVSLLMIYKIVFVKSFKKNKQASQLKVEVVGSFKKESGWLKFIILGFCGGFLVGLTSVGSGSLFIAALLIFYPLPSATLVGTDIFHGAVLTTAAALFHFSIGTVNLLFVAQLLLGSIPGILIGSRLTIRIPEPVVRIILVCVLLFTGIKLI